MTKSKGSAEETFAMMECGSLDINFEIKYGVLLLGNTKAGKTTTAHHLTNQPLIGGTNSQNSIVYHVNGGSEVFKTAKIGDSESDSETQIPNFFTFKQNNETMHLIDCPGYLDSFGCFRVISNRFFHYEVFSKVENVKFLITFRYNDLNVLAQMFLKTFKEFFNGFENINEIQKEIFKCTSIMVTCVPRKLEENYPSEIREKWKKEGKNGLVEAVKEKILSVNKNIGENSEFFQNLINEILNSNRMFIFEEAIKDRASNRDNKILKEIGERSEFWSRKKVPVYTPNLTTFDSSIFESQKPVERMQVSMKNINISITNYLTDSQDFKEELESFKIFYDKIKTQMKEFSELIESIFSDLENISEEKPEYFIKKIAKLAEKNEEKNPVCIYLNKSYEKKRKEAQQKLFETFDLFALGFDGKKDNQTGNRNRQSITSSDYPVWICELKTIYDIDDISSFTTHEEASNEGKNRLEFLSFILKKVLELIYNLCTIIKLKDEKEDKAKNNMAMNYVYELYKNVDILNKLNKLVGKSPDKKTNLEKSSSKTNENIEKMYTQMFFILIEYPAELKQIFNRKREVLVVVSENLEKINSFNLSSNAAEQLAKYFNVFLKKLDVKIHEQNQVKAENDHKETHNWNEIRELVETQIVKLKSSSFESKKFSKNTSFKEMEEYRREVELKISQNQESISLILEHNRILQQIAQKLDDNGHYKFAIEIYKALQDSYSCILVLEKQLKKARESTNKDETFKALMEYANTANNFELKKQAREKADEAHSLAQKNADELKLKKIKEFIYEKFIKPSPMGGEATAYKEYLTEPITCAFIPDYLSEQIMKLTKK